MKFAVKLILGGSCAVFFGLWWLIDGLADGWMNQLLGGLVWKGPLLFLAGVAAVVMGYRIVKEIRGPMASNEPHTQNNGGEPKDTFTTRMTIDGIGLEKIYVFAKGREATMDEMLMVFGDPHHQIGGGEDSGFNFATEAWHTLPGGDAAAALQRSAQEGGDENPGLALHPSSLP